MFDVAIDDFSLNVFSTPCLSTFCAASGATLSTKRTVFSVWCSVKSSSMWLDCSPRLLPSSGIRDSKNSLYPWVHTLTGSSVISSAPSAPRSAVPSTSSLSASDSLGAMEPLKPRYQGSMGAMGWPRSSLRMFRMISRGLWFGIAVLHPTPMPSAPFNRTMGRIGQYHLGSIRWPSSSRYSNTWSSSGWKMSRVATLSLV
mmetsp:Transcript_20134/g.60273  ORF Transcript_20134/g.60273 Transcript_20134/m.60273 type:complete len:200 (-) Transcript_20134:516-1115(-)